MTTVTATQTATTHDRTHGIPNNTSSSSMIARKRSFPLKSFSKNTRSPTPTRRGVGRPDESDCYPFTPLQPRMNIGHGSIFILGCFGC
ncbi:hypothetical protein [Nostoc sp.]|uniref:hypothetical protein n=1 Tax=Nostoc sp. TaxID=1180 RepID=UPI002FF4670F